MHDDGVAQYLGRLYAAHRQELFTYALSITGSPASAEDAVHEAFSRILTRDRLPAEPRPYVFRSVRNAALDVLRWSVREQKKLDAYRAIFEEGSVAKATQPVADLLALLAEDEREIVVLKLYSGLTFKEVAEVCGTRQGTVAAKYWRSMQKLRARLRGPAPSASVAEEHAL